MLDNPMCIDKSKKYYLILVQFIDEVFQCFVLQKKTYHPYILCTVTYPKQVSC